MALQQCSTSQYFTLQQQQLPAWALSRLSQQLDCTWPSLYTCVLGFSSGRGCLTGLVQPCRHWCFPSSWHALHSSAWLPPAASCAPRIKAQAGGCHMLLGLCCSPSCTDIIVTGHVFCALYPRDLAVLCNVVSDVSCNRGAVLVLQVVTYCWLPASFLKNSVTAKIANQKLSSRVHS